MSKFNGKKSFLGLISSDWLTETGIFNRVWGFWRKTLLTAFLFDYVVTSFLYSFLQWQRWRQSI